LNSYYERMVRLTSRLSWVVCAVIIIAVGILSRVVHTGFAVFDKYLGDSLYAMMVYAILRLLLRPARRRPCSRWL
jgi:hypothetical protein